MVDCHPSRFDSLTAAVTLGIQCVELLNDGTMGFARCIGVALEPGPDIMSRLSIPGPFSKIGELLL